MSPIIISGEKIKLRRQGYEVSGMDSGHLRMRLFGYETDPQNKSGITSYSVHSKWPFPFLSPRVMTKVVQ